MDLAFFASLTHHLSNSTLEIGQVFLYRSNIGAEVTRTHRWQDQSSILISLAMRREKHYKHIPQSLTKNSLLLSHFFKDLSGMYR